jgi:predicted NBD/HSP70 family sugar kinase
MPSTPAVQPLTSLAVPGLIDDQLNKFSTQSIHAHDIMPFDLAGAIERLGQLDGKRVLGSDIGGDKALTQLFEVRNRRLVRLEDYADYLHGSNGDGYLESLQRAGQYAAAHDLPIGLSWGGPIDGTKPQFHPKFTNLLPDLQAKYGGDLANVLPTLESCLNDAPAGLISGAIEARRHHNPKSVLFAINGAGINMSALTTNRIIATEAGHVEASGQLNSYRQTTPCGVNDAQYVCIERVGSSKAGIEPQWQQATGEYLRGLDIETRYKQGNALATELYDHSALVIAHMIAGTARALDVELADDTTVVVGHGGAFHFPHYGERVQQILAQATGGKVALLLTKDYEDPGSNACIAGAALAALLH